MKPISFKNLKNGTYYLMYRYDECFYKSMQIIKVDAYSKSIRRVFFKSTGDVIIIYYPICQVLERYNIIQDVCLFDNIKIEFFELEASELLEIMCI